MATEPIRVWPFHLAPPEWQALSGNGGDEDWLAFVPAAYADEYIGWLHSSAFGCCAISQHEVEGGTVYIGAHG